MLSIVTQQRDAKMDITSYYKMMELDKSFSICHYEPDTCETVRLGTYKTMARRDQVFNEMLNAEENQNRNSFFIYYMPIE